jgi:glutaredoxin
MQRSVTAFRAPGVSWSEKMARKKNPDLYNLRPSSITVYGAVWCPDCKSTKQFFGEQRVQFSNVDIGEDPKHVAFVEKINKGKRVIPTIIFPDGEILVEPSNAQLAKKLGLKTTARRSYYDSTIIGGGPGGLTVSLYLAREGLDVLVIEKAGLGGQVASHRRLTIFRASTKGSAGENLSNASHDRHAGSVWKFYKPRKSASSIVTANTSLRRQVRKCIITVKQSSWRAVQAIGA